MAPNRERRDVDYQGSFEILQNGMVKIAQDCEVVSLQAPINTINQRSPPSMSSPFRARNQLNSRPTRQVLPVPVISRATEVVNSQNRTQDLGSTINTCLHSQEFNSMNDATSIIGRSNQNDASAFQDASFVETQFQI